MSRIFFIFACLFFFQQVWCVFYPYPYLKKRSYNVFFSPESGEIVYRKKNIILRLQLGQKLFFINSQVYRFEDVLVNEFKGHALTNKDGKMFRDFLEHFEKMVEQPPEESLSEELPSKKSPTQLKKIELKKKSPKKMDEGVTILSKEESMPNIALEKIKYKGKIVSPLHYFDKEINTIIIDAGHGGIDPGAMRHGYQEKDLTLLFSKELVRILKNEIQKKYDHDQKKLMRVIRTRTADETVSLEARTHRANKELPLDGNGLFISLHFNAWINEKPRGMEIYYLGQNLSYYSKKHNKKKKSSWEKAKHLERIFTFLEVIQFQKESFLMAKILLKNIADSKIDYPIHRGIRTDLFYVLRGVLMPSLLVELGFLSSKADIIYLNKEPNRRKLLKAIASGILEYVDLYKETRGFTTKTVDSLK